MATMNFTFETGYLPFTAIGARIVAAVVAAAFFLGELAEVGVELLQVAAK